MGDITLLDNDIIQEARERKLLVPLNEENVKGASYDIRAGDTAILAEPAPPTGRGRVYINLREQGSISIPPGHSCTFHSLEVVNMPNDMQGILFNRTHWSIHRLNYDGGVINPGYRGHLFITVTNLGDSEVKVKYGEALVSVIFIRLSKPARKLYPVGEAPRMKLDEERLPPLPAGIKYDLIELGERVDALDKRMRVYAPLIASTQRIVDSVILGGLGGIIAGAIIVLVPFIKYPWNLVLASLAILLGIIGLFRFRLSKS